MQFKYSQLAYPLRWLRSLWWDHLTMKETHFHIDKCRWKYSAWRFPIHCFIAPENLIAGNIRKMAKEALNTHKYTLTTFLYHAQRSNESNTTTFFFTKAIPLYGQPSTKW